MDAHLLRSFRSELENPVVKEALLGHLARLAATDIPGTPRLVMRERSPTELAGIQHGVDNFFKKHEAPVIAKAEKMISKVPHPLARKVLNAGAKTVIENPEIIASEMVPGGSLISASWIAAKKGLEKGIDRYLPAAKGF